MSYSRISWQEYFTEIVKAAAKRSTCPKAIVGAIIVKNKQIVSTGYNGAPKGLPHCLDEGCIIINGHCKRAVHAEVNAIIQAGKKAYGADLYCTHLPCIDCCKTIIQAEIKNVYYINDYYDDKVEYFGYSSQNEFLEDNGINVEKLSCDNNA